MTQLKLGDKEKKTTEGLTSKVEMALRTRYSKPEWALFFELHGETGHRADAITFNMFPSRSFRILGFEIKASRNDWLNELKNGHKADFFVGQVDEWYIVEAKKGIVKKQELPEGWGLITLQGSRLYTKVHSNLKFNGVPSREFFVRMIQHSYDQNVSSHVLYEAERKGFEKGQLDKFNMDFKIQRIKEKAELVDKLRENGLELWGYSRTEIERIKLAITLLKNLNGWGLKSTLENIDGGCKQASKDIQECQDLLKKLKGVKTR